MSQKVRIERVDVLGAAPFLGLADNADRNAALNILDKPFQSMGGDTARRGSGTSVSPKGTSRRGAVSMKRETNRRH